MTSLRTFGRALILFAFLDVASASGAECSLPGRSLGESYFHSTPEGYLEDKWYATDKELPEFKQSFFKAISGRDENGSIWAHFIFVSQGGDWEAQQTYQFYIGGSVRQFCESFITHSAYDHDKDEVLAGGPFMVVTSEVRERNGTLLERSVEARALGNGAAVPEKYIRSSPVPVYLSFGDTGLPVHE